MPAVPSSLSLDLAIGPQIASAEHINNYTSVQTAINALIAILDGGSVGQVLQLGGSGPDWASVTTGYGTSLPGSPTDGMEYILVDSLTLPTYQWRFRYNAGSSNTDKWEFVGGASAVATVAAEQSTTSGSYVDLTTDGPSFTVPRGGVYDIRWGMESRGGGAQPNPVAGLHINGVEQEQAIGSSGTPSNTPASFFRATITISHVVKLRYKNSLGATSEAAFFANRWLNVTPVRVS